MRRGESAAIKALKAAEPYESRVPNWLGVAQSAVIALVEVADAVHDVATQIRLSRESAEENRARRE